MKSIDVVITWVDGSDKKYKRKIQKYLSSFGSYKKQYLEANEIEYCIKSIIYYASFVRKIFIVSDSQIPKFSGIEDLLRKNKVKIVDHKEIFRGHEEYLPTFNPRSIDALLYRIEGLSDRFVYFNDDIFLTNKIKEEDWFVDDKAVLLGQWANSYNKNPIKILSMKLKNLLGYRPSFNASQSMSANIIGFKKQYFKSYHTARPQIKSSIANFYKENPKMLKKQIIYKFRNYKQYMPYSLCWHLLIRNNKAIIINKAEEVKEIKEMRKLNKIQINSILKSINESKEIKYLNVQDLNYVNKDVFIIFDKWMRKRLKI